MRLVGDCEATGLDVDNDKVHCVVFIDYDTKEVYQFPPDRLGEVSSLVEKADRIYFHNGISYDFPILRNNGVVDVPWEKGVDTLVLSRLYYPDREGGHSLEAWGKKVGFPKIDHEDWSQYSEDMLYRCKTDVEITVKVLEYLNGERGYHNWELAEKIEHQIQVILTEQERHGWKFDHEEAKRLVRWLEGEIERIESKMDFGYYYEKRGVIQEPFKKDGNLCKRAEDWTDEDIGGPFGKIEWHPIRLSQREKVAQTLIKMGWKPTSYTDKGAPQMTPDKNPCPNLVKMGEIGQDIAYHSLCSHRKGQIEGWIENCREDGRVPSVAIGNSTNTGRMAHRVIANVPKASEKVFLGPEMRGLFITDKTIVGWDAEGLELRVLAHYMNDPDFTEAVVNGRKENKTDIHNLMLQASDGIVPDRDTVKNCVYAIVYGAGDAKLGRTAGHNKGSKDKGKKLREKWNSRFPKLESLVRKVSQASERGYLKAIDGRKVWMRRDPTGKIMSHKGLNTLIQATGSTIVKTAVCILQHDVKKYGVDAQSLIIYHDENQAETTEVDRYTKLCYKAMEKTEKMYDFKCPLSIEVKSGQSWRECH